MYNNQFGYNPYYQPARFVPNTIQPVEQPIQQPIVNNTVTNRQGLNGKLVDSIDVVKATEVNLDGSISYFPLTDGSAIVTKQLLTNGTSKTTVYKPIEEENKEIKYLTHEDMKKALKDLNLDKLDDIKESLNELKQEFKEFKRNNKKKED